MTSSVMIAALVLVAAVTGLNVLLTLGVIRRLRQDGGGAGATVAAPPRTGLPTGSAVPAFAALDHAGAAVDPSLFRDAEALIAFMSVRCHWCWDKLPALREHLRRAGYPAGRVLFVVGLDGELSTERRAALTALGRVIAEPARGPVATAFQAHSTPSYVLVREGVIAAWTSDADRLPVPAPAAVAAPAR